MSIEEGHPEATCQRCGGRNLSWWVDSAEWNLATETGPLADPRGRLVILCPPCFNEAWEAATGLTVSWELVIDQATLNASHNQAALAARRRTSGVPVDDTDHNDQDDDDDEDWPDTIGTTTAMMAISEAVAAAVEARDKDLFRAIATVRTTVRRDAHPHDVLDEVLRLMEGK